MTHFQLLKTKQNFLTGEKSPHAKIIINNNKLEIRFARQDASFPYCFALISVLPFSLLSQGPHRGFFPAGEPNRPFQTAEKYQGEVKRTGRCSAAASHISAVHCQQPHCLCEHFQSYSCHSNSSLGMCKVAGKGKRKDGSFQIHALSPSVLLGVCWDGRIIWGKKDICFGVEEQMLALIGFVSKT